MPEPREEKTIICLCGKEFIYTVKDQIFYEKNKYDAPKRCKDCRIKKKADRAQKETNIIMDSLRRGDKVTLQ